LWSHGRRKNEPRFRFLLSKNSNRPQDKGLLFLTLFLANLLATIVDLLVNFAKKVGWRLIYDLNDLLRTGSNFSTSTWNSTNAQSKGPKPTRNKNCSTNTAVVYGVNIANASFTLDFPYGQTDKLFPIFLKKVSLGIYKPKIRH
jgi:hypothetical protein